MKALLHHLQVSARPATPAAAAMIPVDGLAGASGAHETGPARAARNPAACRIPAARPCPAGPILLASIVGLAICATWIAITWRAWG